MSIGKRQKQIIKILKPPRGGFLMRYNLLNIQFHKQPAKRSEGKGSEQGKMFWKYAVRHSVCDF